MPEKLDFITPTLLKILYLFHEDPMQELHEREVVRQAKVSKGSANKILIRLQNWRSRSEVPQWAWFGGKVLSNQQMTDNGERTTICL